MKLEYWLIATVALAVLEWVLGAVKKNLGDGSSTPAKETAPLPVAVEDNVELEEMLFAEDAVSDNSVMEVGKAPGSVPENFQDVYAQECSATKSLLATPQVAQTATGADKSGPVDQEERDVNGIAEFLRNHSDQAVIVKEILSPPLALR